MKFRDLAGGMALKLLLDRLAGRPAGERPRRRRRGLRSAAPGTYSEPRPAPRGKLFGLMIASAVVAVPLMIIFESPVTRVIGVLGLVAFIVSGVFVIADPVFLEEEGGT